MTPPRERTPRVHGAFKPGSTVRNVATGKVGTVVDPRDDADDPLPADRSLVDFGRVGTNGYEQPIWCLNSMLRPFNPN